MLIWAGIMLIALGGGAFAVDRKAVHFFYDRVGGRLQRFLSRTTHLAKAAHWLAFACLAWAMSAAWLTWEHETALVRLVFDAASAFILALGAGSATLHLVKFFLCRRRPRDELEMGQYGFVPLGFDLSKNSFPSGHSLTIMIVATMASALWPCGAPLWFALALWLSLTRALLNAHFLSDVFVGAGVGVIAARVIVVNFFPYLAQSWF
jgi:membrane-associated phospholipid phosphatase